VSSDEIKHVEEVSRAIHELYGMIVKQMQRSNGIQQSETVHSTGVSRGAVAS